MERKELLKKRIDLFNKINEMNGIILDDKISRDKSVEVMKYRNKLKDKYKFYAELLKRC